MNWQNELDGELLSIAEVRVKTGVSARTLRYYEELGLLPDVRRRAGGRRVYGPDEIERLDFIQRLKKLGLSLAEVKELAAGGSFGSIMGRNAFQRSKKDAISLLNRAMDIYRDAA